MNRLKFRAWNGEEMKPLFSINSQEGHVVYNGEIKDWPIMQFTGLTDRNRVEAYIKDIAALHLLQETKISVIEIHDKWEIPAVKFFDSWEPLYIYMGKDKDDTCVEIIGNIHQHPHLLEEE